MLALGPQRLASGAGGGGGPALAYSPVQLIMGDSQALGTLSAAGQATAVANYVVTPKVKVLNASGAWVTYTPGTITGMSFGTNTGNVGCEIGFIASFRTTYPNDTLYIIKESGPGSYQSRGAALNGGATSVVTSTGNSNISLNSGSALNSNAVFVGGTLETGVYFPFGGFLSSVGLNGGRSGAAFTSQTIVQYNGTLSFSATEGLFYNGNSGGISNGARARIVAGLALLTTPKIVCLSYFLGTNDMNSAPTGAAFAADLDAAYDQWNNGKFSIAGLPLTNAVMVMMRVRTGGSASTTVRAAQDAKAATLPAKIKSISVDAFTAWDGTHLDLDGQTFMGTTSFTNTVF